MRKLQTGLTAVTIAAAVAVSGIAPAGAAPTFLPQAAATASAGPADVIQVRDGIRWRKGWYNGYRGYPNYRRGYREYNGWWFPAGAFVAGALIGGALSTPYYGNGYYANSYYGNSYYGGGYYQPRYYAPAQAYYPPGSSYRQGYRDGYRDGYTSRYYRNDITCTERLEAAGKC